MNTQLLHYVNYSLRGFIHLLLVLAGLTLFLRGRSVWVHVHDPESPAGSGALGYDLFEAQLREMPAKLPDVIIVHLSEFAVAEYVSV